MREEVVLISMPINQLENLIIDSVNACLKIANRAKEPERKQYDPDQLLRKSDAAKLLNCSHSTIDNYARAGVLKRHYVGRAVRFKRSDVLGIVSPQKKAELC
jgi:excisionase family DNA binding protein